MPAVSMLTTEGTTALVRLAYSSLRRESSSTSPSSSGAFSGSVKDSGRNWPLFPVNEGRMPRKPPLNAETARKAATNTAASASSLRNEGFMCGGAGDAAKMPRNGFFPSPESAAEPSFHFGVLPPWFATYPLQ